MFNGRENEIPFQRDSTIEIKTSRSPKRSFRIHQTMLVEREQFFFFLLHLSSIFLGISDAAKHTKICECPKTLSPVCASNKKVFGNICEFNCFKKLYPGIEIANRSFCAFCSNPGGEQPVCGSTGVIYRNMVEFECDQKAYPEFRLKVKDLRYCTLCSCPRFFEEQICGSNGIFFANGCDFECFKRIYRDSEVVEVDISRCLNRVFT